jgi:WD repeat-containing protein 61
MLPKKIAQMEGHRGAVYSVETGATHSHFFSGGSDQLVAEWDLNNRKSARAIARLSGTIYSLHFCKETALLFAGDSKGGIYIFQPASGKQVSLLQHGQDAIFDIQTSFLNKRIYTASGNGKVCIWDMNSFSLVKELTLSGDKIRHIEKSPEESVLSISCGDGSIHLMDAVNGEVSSTIQAHHLSVYNTCFHPNGKYLLSGGRDAHLKIWKLEDLSLHLSLAAHNFSVYDIAFHPEGKCFATASRDKTIKVWDPDTFSVLARISSEKYSGHTRSVNTLIWTKPENYLVSSGDDGLIMVWSTE